MKTSFILSILLTVTFASFCQEKIIEANLSLTLPNESWVLLKKQDVNNLTVYFYKRESIPDSLGRTVIPTISVVIEGVSKDVDVITYSMMKRSKMQFNVDKVFTNQEGSLDLKTAIGYKGTYSDKFGEHLLYIVHAVNNEKGIQIIMDALSLISSKIEPEFKVALKSLKFD